MCLNYRLQTTESTKYWCTRRSAESSGWKVAAITLPWRTSTGSSPRLASTSTPLPSSASLGARIKTISSGPPGSSVSAVRIAESICLPYALRSATASSAPRLTCAGFLTSRESSIAPAQVPKTGEVEQNSFNCAKKSFFSRNLKIVVDSPPGKIRPSIAASCCGNLTSTGSPPTSRKASAWAA